MHEKFEIKILKINLVLANLLINKLLFLILQDLNNINIFVWPFY